MSAAEKIIHRADTRGKADHGWLKSRHTFSFADYYEPTRMNFGALRVLNDDTVAPAQGFGTHPHRDMEIVSIPLAAVLVHQDSDGNRHTICPGDVQIMSAGTGILHSEYNASSDEDVKFLQIWLFPKQYGLKPQYDQKNFDALKKLNKFRILVSPSGENGSLMINQEAFFSLADIETGAKAMYKKKNPENGLYLFVINGEVEVADELLKERDALGLTGIPNVSVSAKQPSTVLLIEVPMDLP